MAKKWKVRATAKGGETTVKALISHPMETGRRKNKKTGKMYPAHFIQELNAESKGKNVLNALWGPAVSANPYLSFKFQGAGKGDKLKLTWTDNKGESSSTEVTIK